MLLTLVLHFAYSCNNNDILLLVGYNYNIQYIYNNVLYIGIVCDGWDHPINVIPLIILLVCILFGGAPRSFTSVWVLMNATLIHMWMDG